MQAHVQLLQQQNNQPREIVPQFPPSASTNQQVLYQLADGTGGFVILNTNDLLGGSAEDRKGSIAVLRSRLYPLRVRPREAATR